MIFKFLLVMAIIPMVISSCRTSTKSIETSLVDKPPSNRDDDLNNGEFFNTYQFSFKRGKRLAGFNILNGRGKDYDMFKDPSVGSSRYYFITNRKNVYIKPTFTPVDDKKIIKYSTGFLEIAVADLDISYHPHIEKNTSSERFASFTNIHDLCKGDKLGFSLFYHPDTKELEIFYSCKGDILHGISSDGIHFKNLEKLKYINSSSMDRDPFISSDGKILVFASARSSKSAIRGLQLYVSIRDSVLDDFPEPVMVPDAINSANELFPCLYQSKEGTFIFFKKFSKEDVGAGKLYSVEIRGKKFLPMVPFDKKSNTTIKYISVFQNRGKTWFLSSYPYNDYDIFSIFLNKTTRVRVNKNGEIQ